MIEAALKWALVHVDYVQVLLVVGFLLALCVVYRAQKNPNNTFDAVDLVSYQGTVSLNKFSQLGAFLISSWGFVYLTVHNVLTEWYFAAYMVSWCGSSAVQRWIASKTPDAPKIPDAPTTDEVKS